MTFLWWNTWNIKYSYRNGYVEFRCKKDKDYLISVQDYFKKLSESNFTYYNIKCYNCKKLQINYKKDEQIFKYCYLCKKDFCYECVEKKSKSWYISFGSMHSN